MDNEYYKEYYLKNKDRMRETLKVWKENNKEHLKEYRREYYREYNRRKVRTKKFIDRILAINLCLVESRLEQNWEDVELYTKLIKKALEEELKLREKDKSNI
jgi:hypothetical protein